MKLTKDEIVKATIVEAAQKLFQHYGLSKTTMEDIAKSLGKSKSSLYYYYSTKEEIFEVVVQQEKEEIFKNIMSGVALGTRAQDKFRIFAKTKFAEIKKRQILHKIVLDDFHNHICLFEMIRKKYDTREIQIIKEVLSFGIENGEFDSAYRGNLEAVSLICATTLRGIQMSFLFGNTDVSTEEDNLLDIAIDMIISGLQKSANT